MMKPRQSAVAAGALLAVAGTALWLAADRPAQIDEQGAATLPGVVNEGKPELASSGSEHGPAIPVTLPRAPDPNPPFLDLFAGDTDGDGRIGVDEWLALEVRPDMPKYWSNEEAIEAAKKRLAAKLHSSDSADPYVYYDDETKIALAEAGDWRAKQDLLRLYSSTGRVDKLKQALLERVDTTDPGLAFDLYTMGENWRDRQPLLGAAFIGAAEELGFDSIEHPDSQELLDERARQAGVSREEMRAAGRELLAELNIGGGQ